MNNDILTIMWKESKGLLRYNDNRWKGLVTLITPVVMFGVILPIQLRDEWLTGFWSIIVAFFTPLILITHWKHCWQVVYRTEPFCLASCWYPSFSLGECLFSYFW